MKINTLTCWHGFHFMVASSLSSHVDSVTGKSSGIQPPGDFLVTNDKDGAYIN